MKLDKIGTAKSEDGIELAIIGYGSEKLKSERVKRGIDFHVLTEKGFWKKGFVGGNEEGVYALTLEELEKWNDWKQVDLSNIEHQLRRLKPATLKRFIGDVEDNRESLFHEEVCSNSVPLRVFPWGDYYKYYSDLSEAIKEGADHPDLYPVSGMWITDRAPTANDANENFDVAHPCDSAKGWADENYDHWSMRNGMPWMTVENAGQYTEDNPAPSFYPLSRVK